MLAQLPNPSTAILRFQLTLVIGPRVLYYPVVRCFFAQRAVLLLAL